FFSSRRRHTSFSRDWSSDVCSSDLGGDLRAQAAVTAARGIQAAGEIVCGDHLEAGWGIKAGGDVIADGAIRVGEGIEAGGRILEIGRATCRESEQFSAIGGA